MIGITRRRKEEREERRGGESAIETDSNGERRERDLSDLEKCDQFTPYTHPCVRERGNSSNKQTPSLLLRRSAHAKQHNVYNIHRTEAFALSPPHKGLLCVCNKASSRPQAAYLIVQFIHAAAEHHKHYTHTGGRGVKRRERERERERDRERSLCATLEAQHRRKGSQT